ncbi:MAG: GGDEF domain-containing protein [Phormidesmis sp.]
MNSVLLIGDPRFTTGVVNQVRGLDSLTVTVVASAQEALPLMAKTAPDVLIIQACDLKDGSVAKTFSLERPNTYFVVIEDAWAEGSDLVASTATPTAYISELHLEKTAFALEAGADAYLWLPPVQASGQSPIQSAVQDETAFSEESNLPSSYTLSQTLPQTLSQERRAAEPLPNPRQPLPSEASSNLSQSQQPDLEKGNLKVRTQATQPSNLLPLVLHPSQCRLIQAHIQIGLNRAQRYRDLSRINDWLSAVALVDALTQLNNRRSFDLELPRKVKVARAKGTPLSLMVIDIDCFKAVNDRYGHLVGDDVLKMLAKRLMTNMRFYDTPFRYGGEEFVVTLSNTDLAEGVAIAQRLRQSIAQAPFEISPNVSHVGQLPLTVSIGITELSIDDDDQGRSCLHRADQYLLKAKATGRNRVVSEA